MSDNWEDNVDDVESGLSNLNLNPTAKEWKPPSWLPAASPATPAPPAEEAKPAEVEVEKSDAEPATSVEEEAAVVDEVPAKDAPVSAAVAAADDESNVEEEVDTPAQEEEEQQEEEEEVVDDGDDDDDDDNELTELQAKLDPREHLNVVFIGHVDAGKSTLSGSILYLMGAVDKRTIEKYEKEAKDRNRESWFLAFIMDTNEEERAKGKTVEVGRAHFETENKRITILDAPGHKNYVPAMIAGASQADVGVLVISARKGEFEAGFDRLGQTREHAMLAKTLGVQKLVVVINKMDEQTVKWNKDRYDEILKKLTPYLKDQCYFKIKKDVTFIPISAFTGDNVLEPVKPETSKWAAELNGGKSLIQILDELSIGGRDAAGPVRVTVIDSYNDRGTVVMGKVESGTLRQGQKLLMNPIAKVCKADGIFLNEDEVPGARPGENVLVRLKGVNEEDAQKGFVLSSLKSPMQGATSVIAQVMVMNLLEHRPLFSAGYSAVFHAHTAIEECVVSDLLKEIDLKVMRPKKRPPTFAKDGGCVVVRIKFERSVCVEPFKIVQQLGRFTLRDEGTTIAIGKVLKVNE